MLGLQSAKEKLDDQAKSRATYCGIKAGRGLCLTRVQAFVPGEAAARAESFAARDALKWLLTSVCHFMKF